MIKINFKKLFSFIIVAIFIILIIFFPDVSSAGVNRGLLISANVIIPSLFPFTVGILFLLKCELSIKNPFINKITYKIFGTNFDVFLVFILSLIGGYPIGAKLINELYIKNIINKKAVNLLLMYCVNAGPAFIISAVGIGVFSSYKIGLILLISHITASLSLAVALSKKMKRQNIKLNNRFSVLNLSQAFVSSVLDASSAILQICSFVILFSAINTYIDFFFKNLPIINKTSFFIEVTSAVTKTNNIILISFLLGFSGLSIWCQIFSILNKVNINYFTFISGRIIHGIISSAITYLIIKTFNVNINVFSNNKLFNLKCFYNTAALSISLLIMLLTLFIYLHSKNNSSKIISDVI